MKSENGKTTSIDLIETAKKYFYVNQFKEANALLKQVHNMDKHSAESALMLGLLSEKMGDSLIALDAYFKALVLNPYDGQALDGFQRNSSIALEKSSSDLYLVKGFLEYCAEWLIPYKTTQLSEFNDLEQVVIELTDIYVIGQSMRIFSSDMTYLMEDFELESPTDTDVVSTTQLRNIVGYKKASATRSPAQVLAVIPEHKTKIDQCIVLSHRASDNYFHWLIEVIPALSLIEKFREFDGLPILVNGHMPKQHFQILASILQGKREVFISKSTSNITLEKGIIPLNINRIVFDPLPNKTLNETDVFIHSYAIEFLRERLGLSLVEKSGQKIYLSRKSSSLKKRKMHNQDHVESLFQQFGFLIVDTAELDFSEQVELFSNASVVAGATGASFTNLVFCSEDTHVVFLTPPQNNIGIYFRTLAKACGLKKWNEIKTIPIASDSPEQFHGDFSVSIEHLTSVLKGLCI